VAEFLTKFALFDEPTRFLPEGAYTNVCLAVRAPEPSLIQRYWEPFEFIYQISSHFVRRL